jgi:hypothetical protein
MRVYHLLNADNGMSDISLHRIRISRIRDLNDPFEMLAVRADDKELLKVFQSAVDDLNRDNGLLCFSRRWHNPVLWSHYASKHRGICLGFDVANELLQDVCYTTDRLPVRFVDGDSNKGLDEEFARDLLRTKYAHWQYEEEVRVFAELDHSTIENGSYFYPFDVTVALREVILGPLCELPIERIRELVHSVYEHVAVIKARLAFKYFDVVADEQSVKVENAYWAQKSMPPPYTFSEPSPEPNAF